MKVWGEEEEGEWNERKGVEGGENGGSHSGKEDGGKVFSFLFTSSSFSSFYCKILVHIGALTDYSGFKLAESAGKGGPLGELVQWSDLIAVLYILGHGLTISTEHRQLRGLVRGGSACPGRLPGHQGEGLNKYDVVFLDITGVREMKVLKVNLNRFRYITVLHVCCHLLITCY